MPGQRPVCSKRVERREERVEGVPSLHIICVYIYICVCVCFLYNYIYIYICHTYFNQWFLIYLICILYDGLHFLIIVSPGRLQDVESIVFFL